MFALFMGAEKIDRQNESAATTMLARQPCNYAFAYNNAEDIEIKFSTCKFHLLHLNYSGFIFQSQTVRCMFHNALA